MIITNELGTPALNTVHNCDALRLLANMPSQSVNCIVTSPPYFGLRDYGVPGQIGLEETPQAYVAKLVDLFREARRVLRDDGTLWLNLGDSYSSGGRTTQTTQTLRDGQAGTDSRVPVSNLFDFLHASIKESVLFIGTRCTLTVSAHSDGVLNLNQVSPDQKLARLFGIKRIVFKERNNDFSQVVNLLHSEADALLSPSVCFRVIDTTTLEVISDSVNNISVVVSDLQLNSQPAFKVSVGALTAKSADVTLSIEKPAEPIAEGIGNVKFGRDTLAINPTGESILNINAVNNPVSFSDTFMLNSEGLRDFGIGKASDKHIALLLSNGAVNLAIDCVDHLYFSNEFGSLVRYAELYNKAERNANAAQPKQELGIPEMVKRAMMEDGWICRSTIIWAKPNPMPESVTDRPTKSHEYIFLFAKYQRYYYDADAIKEPAQNWGGRDRTNGKYHNEGTGLRPHSGLKGTPHKATREGTMLPNGSRIRHGMGSTTLHEDAYLTRNKRDVWTVTTKPFSGAHFATFPPDLIEPMILAGCPVGGVVYDPFMGSGTTALVARANGRNYIGSELNPAYVQIARERLSVPYTLMFAELI